MKFSALILASVASAQDDENYPFPLERLDNLTKLLADLMNESFTFLRSKNQIITVIYVTMSITWLLEHIRSHFGDYGWQVKITFKIDIILVNQK